MTPKKEVSRSRGGCRNCKTRKRKCDEARPECSACQRKGVPCGGYEVALKWTNGIASRGRLAWATTPCTPSPNPSPIASISQQQQQNVDVDGDGDDENVREKGDLAQLQLDDHMSLYTSTQSPSSIQDVMDNVAAEWPTPSSTATHPEAFLGPEKSSFSDGHLDIEDHQSSTETTTSIKQHLFDRFIQSGIHRLYATKVGSWPELFLAEMALDSSALFHVSVAVQAFIEDGLSVSTMEFIDQGVQTFRAELASCHDPMVPATTAAGLLICTLHLLQARPWTQYLQLMGGLYRLDNDMAHLLPGPHQPDVKVLHTLEVLAVMDMPTFVVGRMTPSMGVWRNMRKAQDAWQHGRCSGLEPITGMPRSLLDIFARLSEKEDENVEEDFWHWPGEVGEFLQCHLWDAWRYAGMLTVRHRRRLLRGTREPLHSQGHDYFSEGSTPGVRKPLGDAVLLCRLLSSMDSLLQSLERPEFENLLVSNSLLYPLVAASLRVSLLRTYSSWKDNLNRVRAHILRRGPLPVTRILFEVLDEAWDADQEDFDLDEAARRRGVEIAIF